MDPLLFPLALVGPLAMHLITRDVMGRAPRFDTAPDAVADATWLRAMAPERRP